MSKYMKFLSIGNDILRGMRSTSGEYSMDNDFSLEKLFNLIQWLEALCYQQRCYYSPKQNTEETGSVQVIVKDETGKGVPAQVKFFPIKPDESDRNHNDVGHNHNNIGHNYNDVDHNHNDVDYNHNDVDHNHNDVDHNHNDADYNHNDADYNHNDVDHNHNNVEHNHDNLDHNHSNSDHNLINADCEVNFIREITDWYGRLDTILPAGDYYVEISKGSEYEISTANLCVYPNQTSQIMKVLVRMLNLKKEGWYSGDLHHHSIYSSPVYGGTDPVIESPALVCQSMVAMGASFGALSDHHNILNHKEWGALKSDSFTPILSKEISTSNGHVMSLGVDQDIVYQIPVQVDRNDAYLRNEFIRVTDEIKRLGGVPQINHPCDLSKAISWNTQYNDIIQIFETMEIWNGSNPMIMGSTNDKAFLLWKKLLEEGRYIPATAGSDTHNIFANDYHIYFDKIKWLAELILSDRLLLPEELGDEIDSFIKFFKDIMPILKKWANNNITSAGVRTYVHVEGEVTQEKILTSLKQGHSFLTNGPILIPEIDGKLPGDTITGKEIKVNIKLRLLANRPLKQVIMYTNGNRITKFTLEPADKVQGSYDYSRILPDITICDVDWLFFIAEDDCTNMAITNPIFFERNSHD